MGFTIEYETVGRRPFLKIDGQKVKVARQGKWYVDTKVRSKLKKKNLYPICQGGDLQSSGNSDRSMARKEHEEALKKGLIEWNKWRKNNLKIGLFPTE